VLGLILASTVFFFFRIFDHHAAGDVSSTQDRRRSSLKALYLRRVLRIFAAE